MEPPAAKVRSYRDLLVWQAAVELAVTCYSTTKSFPHSELYGLTSQIRRSSTSIAANIAEGHGREHTNSFIQYLRVAQGSLKELETHLIVSQKVELLGPDGLSSLLADADAIGRMLRSLIRSLQQKALQ